MSDGGGDSGTAKRMQKGQGIIKDFKTVGLGLAGEDDHPEVTGVDPAAKRPGRPPKGEDNFRVIGRTAEEENR